jgi:DNA polymerase-1
MGKLIIIDGNSIANRAFYALPLLSNSSGLHTNAVLGFTTMLLKLLEEEKPTHFLVAFDAGKVTFRHEGYEEYKGKRAKTPPELSEQFPLIRDLVRSFGIAQYELPGYEADDIIGTMTLKADKEGMEVLVVSGDKDMLQLASDNVTILITRKGVSEVERFDPQHIQDTYGLVPRQIIDLKGLMGDSSDNIPGIPGVGEKTALKLLHEYGSVEGVLDNTANISGKMKQKIEENADSAKMSKDLATILRDIPCDLGWDELGYNGYDGPTLAGMFRKLEFKSLLQKMDFSSSNDSAGDGAGDASAQGAGGGVAAGGADSAAGVDAVSTKPIAVAARVLRADELAGFAAQLAAASGEQALHVEVVGDNPHRATALGLAFCTEGQGTYVPLDVLREPEAAPLLAWLADAAAPKRIYDLHRVEAALAWAGVPLAGVAFDVLLAAYLLDPTDSALTFDGLATKYTSLWDIASDDGVFGKGAKFAIPELQKLAEHMCRKTAMIDKLTPIFRAKLEETGMSKLNDELELPLSSVLCRMEKQGIKVDKDALRQFGEELGARVDELVAQIYEQAGTEFNINSTKQLGTILFDTLGLPVVKKTKTGYSTDVEVLEKLEPYHDIVKYLLNYRQLAKLQSTYVEGLLKEVNDTTGKVHTYYKQTIAATGRLSSQYPNLQNIPIRLEEGKKIRKVFVPSEPGWSILSADYSQIELRVLAHISQDPKLIEAFANNLDIHTKTAMDVFGVEESQVDSDMRRQAKAVNFGIVYGISDYGLSQNLGITRKDAAVFIEQYFVVFQGVRKFMDDIVKQARQDGYVTTLMQRRRYLPEILASNFNLRSFAERTAMNTPIQGSAADIIKLAMVQMADRLREEKLRSRMLLQVHDELVFEVPEDELETMRRLVPDVMESALKLDVPLRADVSSGADWYEAK